MIKMSSKYGNNPSKVICFWCGEPTGDVALLGHIMDSNEDNSDREAPDRIIANYELCRNCRNMFEKGVGLIEVVSSDKWKENEIYKYDPKRPELIDGLIPTGRFYVLKESAFSGVKAGNIGFLTPEEFANLKIENVES